MQYDKDKGGGGEAPLIVRTSSPKRASYRDRDCATREPPPAAAPPVDEGNRPYRSASSPTLRAPLPPADDEPAGGDPKKSANPPSSLPSSNPRRMEADCGGDWLFLVLKSVADAEAAPLPPPPPPPKKWVDLVPTIAYGALFWHGLVVEFLQHP